MHANNDVLACSPIYTIVKTCTYCTKFLYTGHEFDYIEAKRLQSLVKNKPLHAPQVFLLSALVGVALIRVCITTANV
jgi:hypothetical protein